VPKIVSEFSISQRKDDQSIIISKKPLRTPTQPNKKVDQQPSRKDLLENLRVKEAIEQSLFTEIDKLHSLCSKQQTQNQDQMQQLLFDN
jgi:hypothetical protein